MRLLALTGLVTLGFVVAGPSCRPAHERAAVPVKASGATLDERIRTLSSAFDRDSTGTEPALQLGRVFLERANDRLYRSRSYLIPALPSYAVPLGERDRRRGDALVARRYLLKALGDGHRADILTDLGNSYLTAWRLDGGISRVHPDLKRAAEYFTASLQHDTSSAEACRGLGFVSEMGSDYDHAATYLRRAVALEPTDADTWVLLGDVYRFAGDRNRAWDAYYQAMDLGFDTPENYLHMATIYASDDMTVAFHKSIQKIPSAIKSYFNLGVLWFRKNPDRKAIELCTEALAMDSTFYAVYPLLAEEYFALGDTENALRATERAFVEPDTQGVLLSVDRIPPDVFALLGIAQSLIERSKRADPGNPFFWYAVGERASMFEPRLALRAFERVIALNPEYTGINAAMGDVLARQKDTVGAAVWFERAYRKKEDMSIGLLARERMISYYVMQNRRDRALTILQRNIKHGPEAAGSPYLSDSAAHVWWVRGKRSSAIYEAWADWRLGLEYDYHSFVDSSHALAFTAAAMKEFKKAVTLAPDFPLGQFGMGMLYARRGDNASAARCFESGVKGDPGNGLALAEMGICLEKSGEVSRALAAFKRSRSTDPDLPFWSTEMYGSYGRASAAAGHFDDAIGAFKRALQLWPRDAEAFYDLAMVYAKQGDKELTRKYLEESANLGDEKAKETLNKH